MRVGAEYKGGVCSFTVWAPFKKNVYLELGKNKYAMQRDDNGYWHLEMNAKPGQNYFFIIDEKKRPDPASRFQPMGVHGPCEIVDQNYKWQDKNWKNIARKDLVIYELHVGTFTKEATFGAIIPRLNELKKMGINAIELMPVSQNPGKRNWGYDGVYPYAVQENYGGVLGLKNLVNACHKKGIAVILDVVYNHLGPEGNYFNDFAPYFTDKYKTPWGPAINFDDSYSDQVRNYFIQNAMYWFREFHIDGLRLDAVHAILDMNARPFLQELSEKTNQLSKDLEKSLYLFAESNLNKSKLIRPVNKGGYGLDSEWLDDFHHSLHALLTGERQGYYIDYGSIEHLKKCINNAHVYDGVYSVSRKASYGDSAKDIPKDKFIVFTQNHDQVGNRLYGERLSKLVDFEALKLAAGCMLLFPYIPLIFMGEEYAEDNPFLYFIDHCDKSLIKAVREGRKKEFSSFNWTANPPDPKSKTTFEKSKLDWKKRNTGKHKVMKEFYTELIRLRKKQDGNVKALSKRNLLILGSSGFTAVFNFNGTEKHHKPGPGKKLLDSAEKRWLGPGSVIPKTLKRDTNIILPPKGFVLFQR